MTIEVCCLWIGLLSAMGSDLSQTAEFTKIGSEVVDGKYITHEEGNPFVKWIVSSKSSSGEKMLGGIGAGAVYLLETSKMSRKKVMAIETIWMAGHLLAVRHNMVRKGIDANVLLILPPIVVRF